MPRSPSPCPGNTALRTLDRRNPPPSIAVGRANRAAVASMGLISRRNRVRILAGLTN